MNLRSTTFRLVAVITAIALAVLMIWLAMPAKTSGGYGTPERAVIGTCHARGIMGNYTPGRLTNIRIGWQEKGDAPGFGWSALVVREGGGYWVKDCKYQGVAHA